MLATIETERLVLRNYKKEDAQSMHMHYCGDAEVTRYMSWYPHPDVHYTQRFLEEGILPKNECPDRLELAITLKGACQHVIGNVVAWKVASDTLELAYVMGRKHQGQGYMREAVQAVLTYLFTHPSFQEVIAYDELDNAASGAVMRKCGLTYQKNILDRRKIDPPEDDVVVCALYSMQKNDWMKDHECEADLLKGSS